METLKRGVSTLLQ